MAELKEILTNMLRRIKRGWCRLSANTRAAGGNWKRPGKAASSRSAGNCATANDAADKLCPPWDAAAMEKLDAAGGLSKCREVRGGWKGAWKNSPARCRKIHA